MNASPTPAAPPADRSRSLFSRRLGKFRRLKRGYYSFLLISTAYLLSFFLPLIANNVTLVVHYNGQYAFPFARFSPASTFGLARTLASLP